jgi:hypothetical protein
MDEEGIEKIRKEVQRAFDTHEAAAFAYVLPLANMLMDSPDRGIDLIVPTYNRALDEAYTDERGVNNRALVQAECGGPKEDIPWAVYNAVGAVYPYLDRKQKNRALGEIIFRILDTRNTAEVNGERGMGHTTGIREPLLLSDICIARPAYFPGLYDEQHLWKDKVCFCDLRAEIMDEEGMFDPRKVNSDFLVAYALLRSDFTSFGEEYAEAANPAFLERVLKGITALAVARCRKKEEVEEGMRIIINILPSKLHKNLLSALEETDWADYMQFR